MVIVEITEGFTAAYAKKGNKSVRKYRCTSGPRKGRVVAKASTCNAPINTKARHTMKKTRASQKSSISKKTSRTKKTNPGSIRTKKINRSRNPRRSRGRGRKI